MVLMMQWKQWVDSEFSNKAEHQGLLINYRQIREKLDHSKQKAVTSSPE